MKSVATIIHLEKDRNGAEIMSALTRLSPASGARIEPVEPTTGGARKLQAMTFYGSVQLFSDTPALLEINTRTLKSELGLT